MDEENCRNRRRGKENNFVFFYKQKHLGKEAKHDLLKKSFI